MYPTFGVARDIYIFRYPHREDIKRRSGVFPTNLTVANAHADRISGHLKSDFAAIAATCPLLHLDLLSLSAVRDDPDQ
jgi:hypothetical protein